MTGELSDLWLIWRSGDFDRQLGADERTQAGGEGGFVEARGAGDAVAVEQRHRRIAEHGRAIDQRLGHRRRAQEARTLKRRGVRYTRQPVSECLTPKHRSTETQKTLVSKAFKKNEFPCFRVSVFPCEASNRPRLRGTTAPRRVRRTGGRRCRRPSRRPTRRDPRLARLRHHSPDVRHGPAACTMAPLVKPWRSVVTRTGRPSCTCTRVGIGKPESAECRVAELRVQSCEDWSDCV